MNDDPSLPGPERDEPDARSRRDAERRFSRLGWALVATLLAYAAWVHHGIGPARAEPDLPWYATRAYLFEWDWFAPALASPARAFAVLGTPAILGAVGVLIVSRSAFARALALSCVAATLLFVFYGVVAPFPWEFFGWRGSAVLVLTAAVVGFSLAAPWLAASWLRLAWPWRIAVLLPFVAFVLGFLRNATGTDPSLPFAISPWPAVAVFGLEVGALFVTIGYLGAAIGVAATAHAAGEHGARAWAEALAGIAAALAVPALLLVAGSSLSLLPFRVGAPTLIGTAVAVGVVLAAALGGARWGAAAVGAALVLGGAAVALSGAGTPLAAGLAAAGVLVGLGGALRWDLRHRERRGELARRARWIAVGAALVGGPLVAGQAWAYYDYWRTREVLAREIIDGLQRYVASEGLYPDDLDALVQAGDLASVPKPAIGFGFLYDGAFRYQSFGSSFMLEFPAPRWVECAYTPPYEDEDEDEPEADDGARAGDAGEAESEGLDESWSCPSRPPELW